MGLILNIITVLSEQFSEKPLILLDYWNGFLDIQKAFLRQYPGRACSSSIFISRHCRLYSYKMEKSKVTVT